MLFIYLHVPRSREAKQAKSQLQSVCRWRPWACFALILRRKRVPSLGNKFRFLIQAWRSYTLFETFKRFRAFGAVLVMSLFAYQSETEQMITLMYSITHYILVYSVHNCSDKNCTSQRIKVKNSKSKENYSSLYILYEWAFSLW